MPVATEPKPICFVVSPIGDAGSEVRRRADQLIKFVINPALAMKYEVIRADHITIPGSINRQVFDHLLKSALVVADLTGHNPNVFYELAVRHAAAKPFIQVIDLNEGLPFDVSDQRTIKFDIHDLDSVEGAKTHLAAHEEAITKPGFKVETPIGEAILQSAAIASGGDETKVIIDLLEQLQSRLGRLEITVSSAGIPARQHPNQMSAAYEPVGPLIREVPIVPGNISATLGGGATATVTASASRSETRSGASRASVDPKS